MPPASVPTLDALLDLAWQSLVRGANDARHGFHLPVVATVDTDGRPQARTVVLRAADRQGRRLVFHTDARAPKLDELAAGTAWVFYDAKRRLQVRVTGPARLADAATTDARWKATSRPSRKAYLVEPAPGTPVPTYTSGHPGDLDGPVVPTAAQSEAGRAAFAVVTTQVTTLEVLRTLREGHQRARFQWEGGHGVSSWLVP